MTRTWGGRAYLALVSTPIMRNTCSVNAKSALRREERAERVRAGKPSSRLDYRCPICKGWFSRYRNRHGIHLVRCKRKQARRIVEQRERDKTQIPPPHPRIPSPQNRVRSRVPQPRYPQFQRPSKKISKFRSMTLPNSPRTSSYCLCWMNR